MTSIEEYVQHVTEVNRIVQGISRNANKPKEHVDKVWKETEKEVLLKHKYGVTDKYREIGNIVRAKMGQVQKNDDDEDTKKE